MPSLPPPPYKAEVTDQSGRVSKEWSDWFTQLRNYSGGSGGASSSDLQDQIDLIGTELDDLGETVDGLDSSEKLTTEPSSEY